MRLLISRRSGWSNWSGWSGWGALAAGAALCAIGWYGVSGERFAERQIPYLASCTVPGAALIVAGAVLLAAYGTNGPSSRASPDDHTHTEPGPPAPGDRPTAGPGPPTGRQPRQERGHLAEADDGTTAPAGPATLVAVPSGTLLHTADCPLVDGKPEAAPVDGDTAREGALRACPVCEPVLPAPPPTPPPAPPTPPASPQHGAEA